MMSNACLLRIIKVSAGMALQKTAGLAMAAFCNNTGNFFLSFSTHTTGLAPRDAASSPSIPEPAKRSRNE